MARVSGRWPGHLRRYVLDLMNFELFTNPTDDPPFVELARYILYECVENTLPLQVFVVKVDNWFDHKWLTFSGIGRVGFFLDFRLEKDTALDEFRQEKVTRPPFNPNRIIGEWYFLRNGAGDYEPSLAAPFVHERKLAPSAENLHKRLTQFSESAIFVWVSSNTKSNRRGSIMVYEVHDSDVHTWYASFSKGHDWELHLTKGIARERVALMVKNAVLEQRT